MADRPGLPIPGEAFDGLLHDILRTCHDSTRQWADKERNTMNGTLQSAKQTFRVVPEIVFENAGILLAILVSRQAADITLVTISYTVLANPT